MKYQIKYGFNDRKIDITQICLEKCTKNGIVVIPENDNVRAHIFSDPLFGVVKYVYIYGNDPVNPVYVCDLHTMVFIDTNNDSIFIDTVPDYLQETLPELYAYTKLKKIHSKLQIKYGTFNEEVPEQMMAVRFLTGDEKVLEIGGNIGRNSLIIAHILKEKNNHSLSLVTLESDPNIAEQLTENKELNGFDFFVEASALSKRNLIQYGWDTFESDEILEGFKRVNTITWEQLKEKYRIEFDTLVLDCEGAFYSILVDMPEIVDNIKKIFIENDFMDINQKKFVDTMLLQRGFKVKYCEQVINPPRPFPCSHEFFQYWERDTEVELHSL